jgi:hypothetical protein
MEECKIPAYARGILSFAHAVILHSSMPEDMSSMEECNIPAWAREKMFCHQQGLFPFPEMQFSRGELRFKYLLSQCVVWKKYVLDGISVLL